MKKYRRMLKNTHLFAPQKNTHGLASEKKKYTRINPFPTTRRQDEKFAAPIYSKEGTDHNNTKQISARAFGRCEAPPCVVTREISRKNFLAKMSFCNCCRR